jgi:hypothetical protein
MGGLFSYSNSVFNKTASTLGTNLPSIADFDIVRANTGSFDSVVYIPANGAHWTNPDPTTIKQAIDRLAARLFAISGSIP